MNYPQFPGSKTNTRPRPRTHGRSPECSPICSCSRCPPALRYLAAATTMSRAQCATWQAHVMESWGQQVEGAGGGAGGEGVGGPGLDLMQLQRGVDGWGTVGGWMWEAGRRGGRRGPRGGGAAHARACQQMCMGQDQEPRGVTPWPVQARVQGAAAACVRMDVLRIWVGRGGAVCRTEWLNNRFELGAIKSLGGVKVN